MRVGADRILDPPFRDWIASKRVGLVTNPAGLNSRLEPTAAVLARSPGTEVAALFGPEHGFLGHEAAEAEPAFDREQQRTLRAFLAACDAVKFARARPSAAETARIIDTARGFVQATADAAEAPAHASAPTAGEAGG